MAEETAERGENAYDWQSLMFLYNAAIKEVRTKLDIMNDEFQYIHQYNPIEYIKSRIKTPNSIAKKLSRHGLENTMENMVEHINDIAGVRIVCSFTSDIYRLAEMIGKQKEFTILYIKDYMKHPKESGYRSYHMLITVPIQTTNGINPTKVEIQIRTIAMDFWASLEHKLKYKKNLEIKELTEELKECAEESAVLDVKMDRIRKKIEQLGYMPDMEDDSAAEKIFGESADLTVERNMQKK